MNSIGSVVVTDIVLYFLKTFFNTRLISITFSLSFLQGSCDPFAICKVNGDYSYDSDRASKAALRMFVIEFYKRQGDKIKMWGGDNGWLATGLANAEVMRELEQVARFLRGGRDADVGEVVGIYGIRTW